MQGRGSSKRPDTLKQYRYMLDSEDPRRGGEKETNYYYGPGWTWFRPSYHCWNGCIFEHFWALVISKKR